VTKRTSLVRKCTAVKNQLHTYIAHHYPSYKEFFYVFDGKAALEFWEKYPSPRCLNGVDIVSFTKFLQSASNNICAFDRACHIFGLIEEDGYICHDMQDTSDFIVSLSVRQLKDNRALIKTLDEKIKALVPGFGYKLETMKGINYTTAAGLIVEIGDINRFRSAAQLASYAGISPVEYSSGSTERNFSNKRGNRNLNQLIFYLAVSLIKENGGRSGPFNGIFAEYYNKKLSEGKTKKQSIKCVMRRLINIIYRMMKDKSEYRPPA